jgi:hypothetical protein
VTSVVCVCATMTDYWAVEFVKDYHINLSYINFQALYRNDDKEEIRPITNAFLQKYCSPIKKQSSTLHILDVCPRL